MVAVKLLSLDTARNLHKNIFNKAAPRDAESLKKLLEHKKILRT